VDRKKIAIIFDFDDTLAPDSTSAFLEWYGIDVEYFWEKEVNPLLLKGWDPIPAFLFGLIEKSKNAGKDKGITLDKFRSFGAQLKSFQGVPELIHRLKAIGEENKCKVEFFIISSGIEEIIKNTSIAPLFKEIWASAFHFNPQGTIEFPRKVVSFTDKTRYLFQINKGIFGEKSFQNPYMVNERVLEDDIYIPLNNFIYVGDGYTDIPCFSIVKRYQGVPVGVYEKKNKKKYQSAWRFVKDERVSTLVSADYSINSDLSNTLEMALLNIINR